MKKWLANLLKTYFFVLFPFIIVFLASLYNPADSDLGWHLKYGEYFFQHASILRENIFSTEMPGYKWSNSSWATDLLFYITFKNFGFFGLTVLGGLVVTISLFFLSRVAKLSFWEKAFILPIIVFLEEPLTLVSFRGHLLTLLFLGILYFLLGKFLEGKRKFIIFVIPLFSLWSNFHGEFILGLGLFFAWINLFLISQIVRKKPIFTEIKFFGFIFFSSLLATLLNPFGIDVYKEASRHFGNPLQKYIIEWLPFDQFTLLWWNLVVWGVVIAISLWIIRIKKQFIQNLPLIGLTILLYILSFWMRRYAWPMYLVSIPVVVYLFQSIKPKSQTISNILAIGILLISYFYVSLIKFPRQNFATMSWKRYCQDFVGCSPKSAEFLIKNKPPGKMLTFYNWGGFLIRNYPEVKPSIDGRMHLWRDEKGYSAFEEYYPYEQNWKDINQSKYDIVYMTPNKPLYKQMMQKVKENTWEILYYDKNAYVFARKNAAKT